MDRIRFQLLLCLATSLSYAQDPFTRIQRHLIPLQEFARANPSFCGKIPYLFSHELMSWCERSVARESCCDALFSTWDLYQNHRARSTDEDMLFLFEFSLFLFGWYQHLFLTHDGAPDGAHHDNLVELFAKISRLPIGALLDTLDECFERFAAILSSHHLPEAPSWRERTYQVLLASTIIGGAFIGAWLRWSFIHQKSDILLKEGKAF